MQRRHHRGGAVRGRDRHYISSSFSVKSRIFVSNKKLRVQEALLWGRKKNTSRKHSWMDESHEEDSQHNQFGYKRNLKSSRWRIRNTLKVSANAPGRCMHKFPTGWEHVSWNLHNLLHTQQNTAIFTGTFQWENICISSVKDAALPPNHGTLKTGSFWPQNATWEVSGEENGVWAGKENYQKLVRSCCFGCFFDH